MKRTNVFNLLGLAAGVCTLYLLLNVFSYRRSTSIKDTVASDLLVSVKNIFPGGNGKVDLTLSIDIDSVLKQITGYRHPNGEATANPVPRDTTFVKNVPTLCKDTPGLQYIVYVHTSPGNEKRRDLVRRTWGDVGLFRDGRLRVVFMAGMADNPQSQQILDREYEKYHDIVQGDFLDSYHNLTLKALMGLKWVSNFCREANYAIKADDDAFIDIFGLLGLIQSHEDPQRVIMCPMWSAHSMPILRDPAKCMKWCVKYSEFPGMTHFPQYCAGLTYVISNDIVPDMFQMSRTTPFFWIDDVYVTGILTEKVKEIHYVNFLKSFTLKEKVAKEDFLSNSEKTKYLVAHVKNNDTWIAMWESCMRRLSNQQLPMLSSHVIEQHPNLAERWKRLQ